MTGFRERFGGEKVMQVPSVMGGEDFSQFKRAAPDDVQSLIFWVGGVRHDEFAHAQAEGIMLPSLHSPFWAPDAEKVIATGAEALASATLRLMARKGGGISRGPEKGGPPTPGGDRKRVGEGE